MSLDTGCCLTASLTSFPASMSPKPKTSWTKIRDQQKRTDK